jgi:L-asparaginase
MELLREMNAPVYNPLTDLRLEEWIEERQGNFNRTMASVVAEKELVTASEARRGTIGVVALDSQGALAVGTSTGGKGFERIGRVSDSAMPAGNYANRHAAVSCTGIGEDIIEECLAAKVVVRVTDGLSLREAMERSFIEAQRNERDCAAISLDHTGAIAWGKCSQILLAAYHTGEQMGDTLDMVDDVDGID